MNVKDSLFAVVAGYEWKQLCRTKSFIWLTLLLLLIGIYAIIYGRSEVSEQRYKISLLQTNIDSLYKATSDGLQNSDTTAAYVGEYIGRLHANRPDDMAALAFGQRDIHKFAMHITNGSFFYNKYSTGYVNKTLSNELVNPFKLLSGHLDISFVLVFLFPLYLILLTYNVYSAEFEDGTLGLLGVQPQPISIIIFQKLFLRVFTVISVGLILLLISGIVNQVFCDKRFWWFILSFIAYIFCWAGIISLIISFKKSSAFTSLALVSVWILFTLLIPSLLNGLLNVVKPISTRIELSAAVQKANAEVWELSKKDKIDSFKIIRPYYATAFDSVGGWEDPKYLRLNHFLTDYYIEPFENKRIAAIQKRNQFADKLNYFSPVLMTQSICNELSGSNMQQMLAFDTLGYSYFKKIMRFTDDYIFLNNNRITLDDLKRMPSQDYKATINMRQILSQIVLLVVISSIFFFLSMIKMKH